MTTRAVQTYLTPEEYITLERKAIPDAEIVRSEYINGEIIKMPGASFAHNLMTNNISGELRARLKGSECAVFANDMRISIPTAKSYFYPDVGVVCEEPRFEDDVFDTLLNPIVIVEVLSPSTEAYDRGEKFATIAKSHRCRNTSLWPKTRFVLNTTAVKKGSGFLPILKNMMRFCCFLPSSANYPCGKSTNALHFLIRNATTQIT